MTDKAPDIARSALDAITNSAGTRTGQMIHLDVEQWDFVRRLLKDHVEGKNEAALERVRAEERERCASIAERWIAKDMHEALAPGAMEQNAIAWGIIAAIREEV